MLDSGVEEIVDIWGLLPVGSFSCFPVLFHTNTNGIRTNQTYWFTKKEKKKKEEDIKVKRNMFDGSNIPETQRKYNPATLYISLKRSQKIIHF